MLFFFLAKQAFSVIRPPQEEEEEKEEEQHRQFVWLRSHVILTICNWFKCKRKSTPKVLNSIHIAEAMLQLITWLLLMMMVMKLILLINIWLSPVCGIFLTLQSLINLSNQELAYSTLKCLYINIYLYYFTNTRKVCVCLCDNVWRTNSGHNVLWLICSQLFFTWCRFEMCASVPFFFLSVCSLFILASFCVFTSSFIRCMLNSQIVVNYVGLYFRSL